MIFLVLGNIFLLRCIPGNFLILNFILLGVGFLCTCVYSFKSSWALFGIQLSYSETVWSFQSLLWSFVRWARTVLVLRATFLPYWSNILLEYSTQCLLYEVFPIWLWERKLVPAQNVSACFFLIVLSLLFGISQQQVLHWSVLT